MPEQSLKLLQQTWPEVFRTQVLGMIPESAFATLYHAFKGRPNFPVAILVGLSILKEMLDLTDEALMDSFRFDMRFHYALMLRLEDTTMSVRTLYNFRERVVGSPAVSATFERVTDQIIAILGLSLGDQRLDSTHIRSNMANLARLGLFIKTIEQFLARLRKSNAKIFERLPEVIKERYGERPGHFGDVRGTQSQRRLNVVAKDLWILVDRFRADADVKKMHAYKLLNRLLGEQCVVATDDKEAPVALKDPNEIVSDRSQNSKPSSGTNHHIKAENVLTDLKTPGEIAANTSQNPSDSDVTTESKEHLVESQESNEIVPDKSQNSDEKHDTDDRIDVEAGPVSLKKPKEVASNTLQNPSDPDATYSGHKGKGYQMQICETCHKDNPVQIITQAWVEPAHESDQKALIPTIDALELRGLKPKRLFADTNYNSGHNLLDAAARGVLLMAPTPGQANPDMFRLGDFEIDYNELEITSCPKGFQPVKDKIGSDGLTHNLQFDHDQCSGCDISGVCPAGKQAGRLRVHPNDIANEFSIDYSRRREETDAFKEDYKTRAGIESTNAEGKTAHGMGRLWTRCLPKVTFAGAMKVLAINVKRFMRYQCAQILEIADKTAMIPT